MTARVALHRILLSLGAGVFASTFAVVSLAATDGVTADISWGPAVTRALTEAALGTGVLVGVGVLGLFLTYGLLRRSCPVLWARRHALVRIGHAAIRVVRAMARPFTTVVLAAVRVAELLAAAPHARRLARMLRGLCRRTARAITWLAIVVGSVAFYAVALGVGTLSIGMGTSIVVQVLDDPMPPAAAAAEFLVAGAIMYVGLTMLGGCALGAYLSFFPRRTPSRKG